MKKTDLSGIFIILTFICFFGFNSISITTKSNIYLYFVPILLLFLVNIGTILKYFKNGKIDKHILWYTLFSLYSVLSLLWTKDIKYSIRFLKILFFTFIFIISIYMYIDRKNKIFKLINYYTIGLYFMIIRLSLSESIIFNFNRAATFGNSIGIYKNEIAISLIYGIILLSYKYEKTKNKKIWISIFIFLYFMLLANSRKVIAFFILFFVFKILFSTKFTLNDIIKTIIGLILFGCVVSTFLYFNPYFYDRLSSALMTFSQQETFDNSAMERRYYRTTAKDLFWRNPLLGVGINGFATYLSTINYSHVAYSHSNYYELLSTLGIVGFFIYYSQYFKIFIKALSNSKYNKSVENIFVCSFIVTLLVIESTFVSYLYMNTQIIILIMYKFLTLKELDDD